MRTFLPVLLFSSTLALAVAPARAELVVGSAFPMQGAGLVSVFADGASGDVAPLRTIVGGSANPLWSAHFIEYEPAEDVLYVADFSGKAIRVYDAHASGDAAPLRTMDSTTLGQPRIVRVDRARDEMVVIARMCCIYTWPRLAEGAAVAPIRHVPWGGNGTSSSQLNNPLGLALNRRRNEIVVGDYLENADLGYPNRILVFAREADGAAAAPLRVIEGQNTQLGGRSNVHVAVDEASQTVFALVGPRDGELTPSARVLYFAADAEGDAAPWRSLFGPFSGLTLAAGEYPTGLGYDEDSKRLFVSIGNHSPAVRGRVVVLASDGDGWPLAVLSGDATGLDSNPGSAAATFDRVFRDGFEGTGGGSNPHAGG